ncbi:MAG: hypothetical protein JJT94_16425 [Bernardetiaceae bacterium]|nr:hypothetical protein [Bernardetiaceae bacterium]
MLKKDARIGHAISKTVYRLTRKVYDFFLAYAYLCGIPYLKTIRFCQALE